MNMKTILWIFAFCIAGGQQCFASQYIVNIDTSESQGLAGSISFDFTSNAPFTNSVSIFNFVHDGVTGFPETAGGLIQGDIILLLNPAPFTTIADGFFYNQLLIPFTSFGTSISFIVQTTESGPLFEDLPDELSFFAVSGKHLPLFGTSDPLGADAIFSLCIDGTLTGLLNVFEPAVLDLPSSTINLRLTNIGVIFDNSFESNLE